MNITTVLFDLDGTLLPMDQDIFTKTYFKLLAGKMAAYGYEAGALIDAVWKGTAAMVKNKGEKTNEEAFWAVFADIFGEQAAADEPRFAEFYEKEFQESRSACGFNPKAAETVNQIRAAGFRTALATNPIFPKIATESRIHWTGLDPADFAWYTTYENSHFCKPNPAYYQEILDHLGVRAEECLMVGNDVTEDMVAQTLGMKVFLLTDCLINKENKDINQYPHGDFDGLAAYVASLK